MNRSNRLGSGLARSFNSFRTGSAGSVENKHQVSVPLSKPEEKKEVDLSEMTYDEVKELKAKDPFLYYSIPEIRRKSYQAEDSDDDDEDEVFQLPSQQQNSQSAAPRRTVARGLSCPAHMLKNAEIARQQVELRGSVTRCRRLSTEGHSTLAMADLLEELGDLDDSDSDEEDDRLAQMLGSSMKSGK